MTQLNQSIELALSKSSNSKTQWADTPFNELAFISNDERGSWGERLLYMLAKEAKLTTVWNADQNINQDDGTYDVLIEGKRVEVKTSFKGNSANSWQHENISIEENKYDYLVIIDVCPSNAIYFTFLSCKETSNFDENGKLQYFGLKPTFRKNEINKYKVNFSQTSLNKGLDAGITCKWNDYNTNPLDQWSLYVE